MNIFKNIFNNKEFKIKCIDKFDTIPHCDYEVLEIGKEYTVTGIRMCNDDIFLTLKEFPNKEFISDLFEDLFENEAGKKYNVYKNGKLFDEKVEVLYTLRNTFVCYSPRSDEFFEYYLDDDEIVMKIDYERE